MLKKSTHEEEQLEASCMQDEGKEKTKVKSDHLNFPIQEETKLDLNIMKE